MSILIGVSLLGVNCPCDGGDRLTEQAMDLVRTETLVPVSPEQLGSLSTSRSCADITVGSGEDILASRSNVITGDGTDVTQKFVRGAHEAVRMAVLYGIRKAVLRQRDPSCGCGKIC